MQSLTWFFTLLTVRLTRWNCSSPSGVGWMSVYFQPLLTDTVSTVKPHAKLKIRAQTTVHSLTVPGVSILVSLNFVGSITRAPKLNRGGQKSGPCRLDPRRGSFSFLIPPMATPGATIPAACPPMAVGILFDYSPIAPPQDGKQQSSQAFGHYSNYRSAIDC